MLLSSYLCLRVVQCMRGPMFPRVYPHAPRAVSVSDQSPLSMQMRAYVLMHLTDHKLVFHLNIFLSNNWPLESINCKMNWNYNRQLY